MKVLIICSGNPPKGEQFNFKIHQAFIYEQIKALARKFGDFEYDLFLVKGKGYPGYFSNLTLLRKKIQDYKPDILHAHGGHIGILCGLQQKIPILVTFHGSDINNKRNRIFSYFAMFLSKEAIFVSQPLYNKIKFSRMHSHIIPCGIDLKTFYPIEKNEAIKILAWSGTQKKILFSSSFENKIKNYPLARNVISLMESVELIELRNKTRQQVNLMMNACELLILTSFTEGSPQIIKEAMACNIPIVSTDVGDVREIIGDTEGTYICSYNPEDVAEKIRLALQFVKTQGKTNGRERIIQLGLDNHEIAKKVYAIYQEVLKKKKNN